MFVFEHQSLSCLLNCSATVARKLLDVKELLIACRFSLYLTQSVVALVRKKKIFQMFIIRVLFLMFGYFSVFDKI